MRIGIDARLYGPRVGGGGLGRYVEKLIRNLELLESTTKRWAPPLSGEGNEYVIFLRKENWNDYEPTVPNFKKVLAPWRWYTLREQLHMPRLIRRQKLDLIHYPHFNVPIFAKTPFVVTIHDLNLLEYPKTGVTNLDPVRFWTKYLGYRFVLSYALRRAKKIITVSETTRQAILHRFTIPSEQVTTITLGYLTPTKPPDETELSVVAKRPYVLAVGNAYPHKNLHGLLAAFHEVRRDFPNLTLVLAGPEDRFRELIRHRAAELGISNRVVFAGFVRDAELNALYRNAAAYIMPSFLEGFGFPGLEAQASGTPVLASDLPVLHETLGPAAHFFDPKNPRSMVNAINTVLRDGEIRTRLVAAGFENIKRFDWQNTAQKTLAVYRASAQS